MEDPAESSSELVPEEAKSSLAKDALGPAARGFGQEIAPLGKEAGVLVVRTVRLALNLAGGVVWGLERVSDFVKQEVSRRLKDVPENELRDPSPRVLLPAMQALVYTGNEEEIRDLFASLIASDMKADTKDSVHPSFVEIIKQMTPDEANLLRYLTENGPQFRGEYRVYSDNNNPQMFLTARPFHTTNCAPLSFEKCEVGFSNLNRLGLVAFEDKFPITDILKEKEDEMERQEFIKALRADPENRRVQIHKTGIYVTPLGERFIRVCL